MRKCEWRAGVAAEATVIFRAASKGTEKTGARFANNPHRLLPIERGARVLRVRWRPELKRTRRQLQPTCRGFLRLNRRRESPETSPQTRMAHTRINSASGDFSAAGKFGLSHQPCAAQIAFDAPEHPHLEDNQHETENDLPSGRSVISKQPVPVNNHPGGDRRPGKQQAGDVRGFAMLPPKVHLRMNYEPVKRNRQLKEENECRNAFQKDHGRIIFDCIERRQSQHAAARADAHRRKYALRTKAPRKL